MPLCFFVSDLHGQSERYRKLFRLIRSEKPAALFMGGDILPTHLIQQQNTNRTAEASATEILIQEFETLRREMQMHYPAVFLILGNDDAKFEEASLLSAAASGLWHYVHNRFVDFLDFRVAGYSYIPPSPFWWKDWERYDVSRYVDPGCISPEEGQYSVPVSDYEKRFATIKDDLQKLTGDRDLSQTIFLFHSPPYETVLDRAALDGKMIDFAPLDVHIGSAAIRDLIDKQQPLITMHGHVHESARITEQWQQKIGSTYCYSAAHDGPELALVRFDPKNPSAAKRELI